MCRQWDVHGLFPQGRSPKGIFHSALARASAHLIMQFRGWLDDLLNSSWEACQGSDLLIESPSAMSGIHIAEALRIPYYRAFTVCAYHLGKYGDD